MTDLPHPEAVVLGKGGTFKVPECGYYPGYWHDGTKWVFGRWCSDNPQTLYAALRTSEVAIMNAPASGSLAGEGKPIAWEDLKPGDRLRFGESGIEILPPDFGPPSDALQKGGGKRPYGCKCQTLAHKLNGDGCEECNPARALEYAKETIAEQAEESAAQHALIGRLYEALKTIKAGAIAGIEDGPIATREYMIEVASSALAAEPVVGRGRE